MRKSPAIRPRRLLEQRLSAIEEMLPSVTCRLSRRRYRDQARRLRQSIQRREKIEDVARRDFASVKTALKTHEIKLLAVDLFDRQDAYTQRAAYQLWPGVLDNADKIEANDA